MINLVLLESHGRVECYNGRHFREKKELKFISMKKKMFNFLSKIAAGWKILSQKL